MPTVDQIVATVEAVAKHGACAHSRRVVEKLLLDQIAECAAVIDKAERNLIDTGLSDHAMTAAAIGRKVRQLSE